VEVGPKKFRGNHSSSPVEAKMSVAAVAASDLNASIINAFLVYSVEINIYSIGSVVFNLPS